MTVVSNASPVIALAAVGHLGLLQQLYGSITIPQAVYQEIAAGGDRRAGATEVQTLKWIEVQQLEDHTLATMLELEVDQGEAEAIALARELNAQLLLLDEHRARNVALRLGLRIVGTLGVLTEAKGKGLIVTAKPVLDDLAVKAGFRISKELYVSVLQAVDE